ncbi:MAG: hypothetical protein F4047_18930 [Caldilineaceae bacterium SB0670_bin_27]|uniref:Peptidase A2 domain-containing protein n=1 Tax=Caldilineaceae bacterium SB0664_bin_27 TaxID=2605260 RepID=A0A6B0YXV2_9CHLR|nr:aspartyl protease family protein [Caldilineaceae bacterium]MDE0336570.1 aspartyl protease family protein [Caldilineaceae bacterium]MXY94799.1 hypothetical protein [Caldilineaceae bacterium SB0664_bin_27]MYJ80156.1 hypothetical protein [Caldilineaceae bacterium SB0670_bin_27]
MEVSRVHSFAYDNSYDPPAPFILISVDGYISGRSPVTVPAFADSGADGTMLPRDILTAVEAEYADTVLLRGTAGGVQKLDRYTVRIRIEEKTIDSVSAVATAAGSEPLIGRDVLNHLVVTLNGTAGYTEVQVE